jgi:hypothetical protein
VTHPPPHPTPPHPTPPHPTPPHPTPPHPTPPHPTPPHPTRPHPYPPPQPGPTASLSPSVPKLNLDDVFLEKEAIGVWGVGVKGWRKRGRRAA